ncbi:MAG: hypothetical protein HY298_13895 [Verrucomicrobia bacterium]|nr:hypothetical protein [Verrucomicrobiota bacterium]
MKQPKRTLECLGQNQDEWSSRASNRLYHRYYLRPKPILRIFKIMLEDKDVCVR